MRPPRVAAWLLSHILPADERDGLLGDLEETLRTGIGGYGPMRLWLWYWGQALVLALAFLAERFRARKTAPNRAEVRQAVPASPAPPAAAATLQDLRYAARSLIKSRGFSAAAVFTLALGIGASTAIFSVVNGILLRPLALPESERLVALCETNPAVSGFCIGSPPNVEDWDDQSQAISDFGLGRGWGLNLRTDEGLQGVRGGMATPGLFNVLRLTPALGRLFVEEDVEPDGNHVALLSHAMWQAQYGSDPEIIGRTLTLDGEGYTVVGVLSAGAEVPRLEGTELWIPLYFHPSDPEERSWRGFRVYGRLADDATIGQAQEEMEVVAARLAAQYPETNDGWGVSVVPLLDRIVGSVRPTLLIFLGAVGFVLLIGCANVANLLLVRGTGRRRELALRAALGAGRTRLVRLLLAESLMLSLVGGATGLLLSVGAVKAFVAMAPPGIPRVEEVGVDMRVLGFALVLSVLTSLVFGLLPSLQASALDLNQALKEGDHRTGGRSRLGIRGILVVSEVALALVLLIGAGLLTRSFAALLEWEPGFDRENLITTWLLTSSPRFETGEQVVALHSRAAREVEALPSVLSVGQTSAGPLFGGFESDEFLVGGREVPPPGDRPIARWYDIGPNYFSTLGVPLLSGRFFDESDVRGSPLVALINETLANRFWEGSDPLGGQITMYERTMTIVGVVADIKPLRPGEPVGPEIYWPQMQGPRLATFLLIRTAGDPSNAVRSIRERLKGIDPDMRVSGLTTMDGHLGRQLVRPKFNMLLIGIFAAVALVLASVGIYGVVSYSVAQRTREMGIRVALGARNRNIIGSIVGRGLVPVAFGIGIGMVGAVGVTRLLTSMLVGVTPTDMPTFTAVALLLVVVAATACYLPAIRATRVDATVSLREE